MQLITLFKFPFIESESVHLNSLHEQLRQYFRGELQNTVEFERDGFSGTCMAWLLNIPYGSTTYGKQAEALGKPATIRAVANANGKSRPCHRVIGTAGSLTGYGGEIWRKKRLLELEQNAKRKQKC